MGGQAAKVYAAPHKLSGAAMRLRLFSTRPLLGMLGLGLLWMLAMAAIAAPARRVAERPAPLPALGLAADGLTVSGLSSGGYMAGQFQIAFSSKVAGAAVLAAGPYGCSAGTVSTAMFRCSCPPDPSGWLHAFPSWTGIGCQVPPASVLAVRAEMAMQFLGRGIDDPAHLARHRVWLMQGERDRVVAPALVAAARDVYLQAGVPDAAVKLRPVPGAGHGQPVPDGPVACGQTASPFLTACEGIDAAAELLQWLYAPDGAALAAAVPPRAAGLRRFDQTPYRRSRTWDGLDDSGWLYVPADCEPGAPGAAACRLHVVFHGCRQGQSADGPDGQPIDTQFVAGAGYNRWAESNRLVVLYPQVRASTLPLADTALGRSYRFNPEGCWDFWGYTNPLESLNGVNRVYARRSAPQLAAVWRMVQALRRAPRP